MNDIEQPIEGDHAQPASVVARPEQEITTQSQQVEVLPVVETKTDEPIMLRAKRPKVGKAKVKNHKLKNTKGPKIISQDQVIEWIREVRTTLIYHNVAAAVKRLKRVETAVKAMKLA